jgi:peptide-methionine (S)-S-oxide reductase
MTRTRLPSTLWALIAAITVAHGSCHGSEPQGATDVPQETKEPAPPLSQDALAKAPEVRQQPANDQSAENADVATFGAGCFWCVEAVFQEVDGVLAVQSGYAGGKIENPSYRQVCTGTTGHAEVCQIQFDPKRVSYDDLLQVFWRTHDPTTLNRQGNDVGTQYRSVIFYHNDNQRKLAEERKRQLDHAKVWPKPIVTEISPLPKFYKAEAYHQNYYRSNPRQGYCQFVIRPKLEKFRKVFQDKLKE